MAFKIKRRKMLRYVPYQTGERKSLHLDRKKKALPMGKRKSNTGNTYWETRRNRSDIRGKRI